MNIPPDAFVLLGLYAAGFALWASWPPWRRRGWRGGWPGGG